MKHRCIDCGNTTRFFASVVEHHDWVVDGDENFIEDKGCYDAHDVVINTCGNCGSGRIERCD